MLVVRAPADLRSWVAERFAGVLARAACAVLAREVRVDVVVVDLRAPQRGAGSAATVAGRRTRGSRADQPGPDPEAPIDAVTSFSAAELNPKFTFDQFVIGDANRFAHAAALAVAELPGQAYNPLFIYGPPGVGKTHLLHSIGNYVRRYSPQMTVRYTTVERFTNDFVGALRSGSPAIERFKGRYRDNDLLLIDDIQFLAAKVKTEEEFFHTFNALYDTGSQLVLTCDRLPRDLATLEDRLRERFEAGLVADVQPPDLATRMVVLRKRVQHDDIALADPAVLDVIAERIPTNVRALEGALIRVVAFGSLTGRALTPELASEVLDGLYGRATGPEGGARSAAAAASITLGQITAEVCSTFGLTVDELLSAGRTARVSWPRQIAMYLARKHTASTLPAIGAHFGGRGHTTVMHAVRRAEERLATDPDATAIVDTIVTRLTHPGGDRRP